MADAKTPTSLTALTIAAIGVVYGDIGTSPLYAFKEVFAAGRLEITGANVLGVLSLFFWTLTLIVSVKYVALIMRADNHGEGGLMALLALATQSVQDKPRLKGVLMTLGVFGVALFFGDGVITPAISVLSAVEGLEVVTTKATPYILPISLVVLLALFIAQRWGTAHLGRYFGIAMLGWFACLGLAGIPHIAARPEVLAALLPHHALAFCFEHYEIAFFTLGAVFLCVTGAEALYADMGHFGAKPIRLAWFLLVMPCLTLNYLGQGALVLSTPSASSNPFFLMMPDWATLPMVVLATAATVIASQALISGAFSAAKQTTQLGYLPRLSIRHTSESEAGQIYVPVVNWALLAGVALAVIAFRTSSALAAAYGISVSLVMVITTTLTFFVIRHGWKLPLPLCIAATGVFLFVDLAFFASNSLKIAEGGWFPLLMAGALYLVMSTWKDGRHLLRRRQNDEAIELTPFLHALITTQITRVDGTAVFLTSNAGVVPGAMLHNLKHNKALHRYNLFLNVQHGDVPRIPLTEQVQIQPLIEGCWSARINFGFMDEPDVPTALNQATELRAILDPMCTSYFLARETVVPKLGGTMAVWRQKLFAQMHHSASSAADFLKLPSNAVVELGSKIEM
ncbi:potassium transporter Kup [Paracidovorax anthurii]|uniref:Probable potassium transport system protein Kup n=1 Tax=Paracidovorax anthurii TaxID=78229 RepID=A0A328YR18_9BURK|nr:potassium transporter Kup [Paracidovorax anthurii]RAR76461.1 KUP system potassium uptake protein [Paracidovorax anthurii]